MTRPRFIVKLGGAAITHKATFETLNASNLRETARQLHCVYSSGARFVVVHGAGSFGHFQAKQAAVHQGGIDRELVRKGFVETRISVMKLSALVVSMMVEMGIPAVAVSPCGFWSTSNRQLSNGDVSGIQELLDRELIPVLHGDAVLDDALGCTILSGDVIVKHLAFHLQPQFVLFLTNVEGLFDRPPSDPNSQQIQRIVVQKDGHWEADGFGLSSMNFSMDAHDTTGGIKAKVEESLQIACKGFQVLITLIGTNSSIDAMMQGTGVIESTQWSGTLISLAKNG